MTHVLFRTFSAFIIFLGLIGSTYAAEYYRYKDKTGAQVINTHIPPEYVKNGYEVITDRGQILRVIPPAPSAEELAERQAEKKAKEALKRQQAAQREIDDRLTKLYSHPDDAKRALERKLSELDYQISQKKGQLSAHNSKKEKIEAYAAERERAGRKVDDATIADIERLERQIRDINKLIEEIKESKEVAKVKFQKDIERMIEIFNEKNRKKLSR